MKALLTHCLFIALLYLSVISVKSQVNTSDSLALVALYNSTNGPNWKTNTNWLQDGHPVNTWFGIIISGNRVTQISLSNNKLAGQLPSEIGNLTSLEYLYLHKNDLNGSIPPEIGNLVNLREIYFRQNNLSGNLPPEIGNLADLITLNCFNNSLSGEIPPEIGNLASLNLLNLHLNSFTGTIPPEIGNLINLTTLYLNTNSLTGNIPPEIGNLTNLMFLGLNGNSLSGNIPSEIGNLINLLSLNLEGNFLSGNFPVEIGNLAKLEELDFSENNLNGSLPAEIGNLINLIQLNLNDNSFNNMPVEINNLVNLTKLNLRNNFFTFTHLELISGLALNEFYYSPQADIATSPSLINKNIGDNLMIDLLSISIPQINASNNKYKWWKNGDSITTYLDSSILNIANLDSSHSGNYYCTIINSDFPNLTLTSNNISVNILSMGHTVYPDSINENVPPDTFVGRINVNLTNYTIDFAVGNGINDADNSIFTIREDSLFINNSPDYETQQNYHIYIQVTDINNDTFNNELTIHVNNLNDNEPVINDLAILVDENTTNGTILDSLISSDGDGNLNILAYNIISGNTDNTFFITPDGYITINNTLGLDFELTPEFNLIIQASDGIFTDIATLTIHLNNLNDNIPSIENQSFSVNENTSNNTSIGSVYANDADGDLNALTYNINSGNSNNLFTISINGEIIVNNSIELDYETNQQFDLTIEASDGEFSANAIATINIINLNDNAPIIENQSFQIDENSSNGTFVSNIIAIDFDGDLNTIEYNCISGNTNNAFIISAVGEISVNNSSELDYENIQQFVLIIEVSDGTYTDTAEISIDINNIIETGIHNTSNNSWLPYPNPTNGELSISIDEKLNEKINTIEIINSNGTIINQIIPNKYCQQINISNYPKGLYTIRLTGENFQDTKKIILY